MYFVETVDTTTNSLKLLCPKSAVQQYHTHTIIVYVHALQNEKVRGLRGGENPVRSRMSTAL